MCMCACACGGQRPIPGVFTNYFSSYFWRQGLCGPQLAVLIGHAQRLRDSALSASSVLGLHWEAGSWGLNSDSHGCLKSILLSKPSPLFLEGLLIHLQTADS